MLAIALIIACSAQPLDATLRARVDVQASLAQSTESCAASIWNRLVPDSALRLSDAYSTLDDIVARDAFGEDELRSSDELHPVAQLRWRPGGEQIVLAQGVSPSVVTMEVLLHESAHAAHPGHGPEVGGELERVSPTGHIDEQFVRTVVAAGDYPYMVSLTTRPLAVIVGDPPSDFADAVNAFRAAGWTEAEVEEIVAEQYSDMDGEGWLRGRLENDENSDRLAYLPSAGLRLEELPSLLSQPGCDLPTLVETCYADLAETFLAD